MALKFLRSVCARVSLTHHVGCLGLSFCLATAGRAVERPIPNINLWTVDAEYPALKDILAAAGTTYHLVHRQTADYKFLHEPRLEFHGDELFVDFSNAPVKESEPAQIIRGRRSKDDGATWSGVEVVARGFIDGRRVETAPLLSHAGRLWAFVGSYGPGSRNSLGMEFYALDPATDRFAPVPGDGFVEHFVPFVHPQRMDNGNWIIGGHADGVTTSAVAISDGEDPTRWSITRIQTPTVRYPETALMIQGADVVAVVRNDRKADRALFAISHDNGRTFTPAEVSNLPMGESKPFAGTLSTGQHYVIYNGADARNTLLISVTKPGELLPLRQTWKLITGVPEILKAQLAELGVAEGLQAWAYPEAVEKDGVLYVVFSLNKKHCWLAKIPIASLRVDAS